MRIVNATSCEEVEEKMSQLNLKGVFSEIAKAPVPSFIKCHIVVSLSREQDDRIGASAKIRVELFHRESVSFVVLGEGSVQIPESTATLIIKLKELPLNGQGTYSIRVIDVTDTAHPVPLQFEHLLFTVRSNNLATPPQQALATSH